jgi:hypothetical protein
MVYFKPVGPLYLCVGVSKPFSKRHDEYWKNGVKDIH